MIQDRLERWKTKEAINFPLPDTYQTTEVIGLDTINFHTWLYIFVWIKNNIKQFTINILAK